MENHYESSRWPEPKIYVYSRGLPFKVYCGDKGGFNAICGRYDRMICGDVRDNVGLYLVSGGIFRVSFLRRSV